MSEPETTQGQQIAVQRVREVRVVQDPVPMWSTAEFEHMARVAAVMTDAQLLPQTLIMGKVDGKDVALDRQVVLARSLLIANQARLWDMDPLSVAQCCSLVHNRLMYEGKLVHAVVEKKLGISLRYEFGLWDTDHFTDGDPNGAGERLAVRVIGTLPGEEEPRTVEGSAGMWKTTGNGSPWGNPSNWPRQLRYRGAREWTRAHSPGVLLGVITDDEIEDAREHRAIGPQTSGLIDRLSPPIEGAGGFSQASVEAETETTTTKRTRRTKAEMEAARAAEASEGPETPEEPQTASGAIENALDGDDIHDHLRRLAGGGPLAGATDAETHEPEAEPVSSASESLTETELGSQASGGGSTPETPSHEEPESETLTSSDAPAIAPDLQTYIDAVDEPATWADVKLAMKAFFATETFRAMEPKGQNLIRGRTWDSVMEMGQRNPKEIVDPGQDVSGFRLFVEWSEDPEALEGTYAFLRSGEAWSKTPTSAREQIDAAVTARVAFLCDPIGG